MTKTLKPGTIGLTLALLLALAGCEKLPGNERVGKILADNNCGVCHDLTATQQDRRGPHLWGIVGRQAGSVPGFKYSLELSNLVKITPFVWDEAHLELLLTDPNLVVPGTRMAQKDSAHAIAFDGIQDAVNRRDLKAYLKTLH